LDHFLENEMMSPRRQFLQLAASVIALPGLIRTAAALEYPTRPIRLIVGIPAGLAPDVAARLIGPSLSERFGQPVVIENRPGAGGVIGAQAASNAPPDGNTLLLVISGYAASAALYPNITFNFVRDIAPVALIGNTPYIMSVNPAFPAKTVLEFIAYAKANPGKINMASPGIGTAPHLAGELFKMMAGVELVHVPYRESYMPDLLSGHVQVSFPATAQAIGYIGDGKLRALAVTETRRLDVLPDIPAMDEFVPGYDGSGWLGVGAPNGTPTEIIERLNTEVKAVVAEPKINGRLVSAGILPAPMTPAQFGKLIVDATDRWAKVVKFAAIKAE
jgi:tripartite-type tricarboxylate transporter receptor subunit TctC